MITAIQIKNLKSGSLADGKGLYVRVLGSGTKSFIVRKKINNKIFTKTLGSYPEMSIATARQLAKEYIDSLQDVESGSVKTFKDVYDEWIEFKAKQIKDVKNVKLRLNGLVAKFGHLPFHSLTTVQIGNEIKKYTANGTQKLESAKRLAIWLKQLEVYAVNSGYADSYKFQGINKIVPPPRAKPMPSVHPDNLAEILQKFKQEQIHSPSIFDITLTGFYTLLRPNEYISLKWDYIDLDNRVITLPSALMKMKREHVIPVSDQLYALLKRRKGMQINEWLFPSSKPGQPLTTALAEKFFRTRGFKDILVPHGIRSIGRTWFQEQRYDHDLSEMCLAHLTASSTELAYNRSQRLDERRELMQSWSDFVESCLNAEPIKGQGKYFTF